MDSKIKALIHGDTIDVLYVLYLSNCIIAVHLSTRHEDQADASWRIETMT